jgi:hypothetical protein
MMQIAETLFGQLLVELAQTLLLLFFAGMIFGGWLMRRLMKNDSRMSYLEGKVDGVMDRFKSDSKDKYEREKGISTEVPDCV